MKTIALVKITICIAAIVALMSSSTEAAETRSREEQLKDLQTKQILVFMWGWSAEEMAPVAKQLGFQVVHAPHGNDIRGKAEETKTWSKHGFKMIARPFVPVKDPFDPEDVRSGCETIKETVGYYDKNPDIIGFALAWGLYGEGGFPLDHVFSDKAIDAFNKYMVTPGEPLPEPPAEGLPGSLRWVKWHEFRSRTLKEFRRTYVEAAKTVTNKLVGTWSEFYPIENYELNMGDAPGADFLIYDLSFGDVTTDQTRAFAENHGDMQHYEKYENWRNHELPLMARAAGEGVVPIAFQFPMRRGHATDFLRKTTVFIDNIEDEYSLKSGPDIRQLIDDARGGVRKPEVALVYQSFEAAALPGGGAFWFYQPSARFIGGMLQQMGIDHKVIPYEHLESEDLAQYKLVIIPDPMYLNDQMRKNLQKASRVLYSGEYLLTHHDPSTANGNYATGWSAETRLGEGKLRYTLTPSGPITVDPEDPLVKGLDMLQGKQYPADQSVIFDPLPKDSKTLMRVGDTPAILTLDNGKIIHITNRMFNHAYKLEDDWAEKSLYTFLSNLARSCGVNIRVKGDAVARVNEGFPYGSYGINGCIAWNKTGRELKINLSSGNEITIPAYGWIKVP